MTTPTFNKFKSTTIYGAFNNLDYEDNTIQASSNIQRNLTVGGNLSCNGIIYGNKLFYNGVDISTNFLQKDISGNVSISGIINGNKLYYNNVDISSMLVSNTSLNTKLSSYALLSGATFFGAVNGVTALTNDVSSKLATTSFVNNVLSATLTGYANVSGGATFSGALRATTQGNTDSSTLVATTAYVKNQSYLTSASLSNYALTSSLSSYALSSALSNYALLSGATFTGTVNCNNGLTTPTGKDVFIGCNNTFPTTNSGGKQGIGFFWNKSGGVGEVNLLCYGQGGTGGLNIWNSNVTNVPTKLVEFFPSGSVFSTTVDGITPSTSDNSTKFATTAYVKLQNYITSSALSPYALSSTLNNYALSSTLNNYALSSTLNNYALSSSLSNYALSSTLNNYALLSGATFTGTVNCNDGLLNISQPSSTQSPILQFINNLGQARALIYPSVSSSVLRFSILPNNGTTGFEWDKSGTALMSLDLNGNLTTTGSISTPSTTIATQGILTGGTQNLTFPLSSSYLIQTTIMALVNLPSITSQSQMGVEVLFIKNSGSCTISPGSGNVIIQTGLSQSTNINLSQYMRLISTRLSSGGGVYGWMVIGSG